MKCPNCNATDHEPSAKYCHKCGSLMASNNSSSIELPKSNSETKNQTKKTFEELMADLIPDVISQKERLDMHLYFVKKIAQEAGLDGERIASDLNDFIAMYFDFKQEHSNGESFSNSEKRLLSFQANLAHIDQLILDKIF